MKIAILGAGNMGSWLARTLGESHEVRAFDRDPERQRGGVSGVEEVERFAPEMLVNAVTLQNTVPAFREVARMLPRSCLLADVASVKTILPDFYRESGRAFVSIHPMFGPTFADMDALREENAILISESDDVGKKVFVELFARLGVKIYEYSFSQHDEMMSYSLTTPFVSSLVFAACLNETAAPGTTFSRHRKIARGLLAEDDHLLAEVLFNPSSLPQLERITSKLEFLKHIIRDRDFDEMKRFLEKLRERV